MPSTLETTWFRLVTVVTIGFGTLAFAHTAPAAAQRASVQSVSQSDELVRWYLTRGDQRASGARQHRLWMRQSSASVRSRSPQVQVDVTSSYQQFDGVGAALTESSAILINRLNVATRQEVLEELFTSQGASINLLRVPIGASDFALNDYSYNDLPPGQTDPTVQHFTMDRERRELLPLLQTIRRLNSSTRLMLAAWSAPAWMKTTGTMRGGGLDQRWEKAYATYLAKSVRVFHDEGAPVLALSVGNEPYHSTRRYPTMTMDAAQQVRVARHLRSALDERSLQSVKILGLDHNWSYDSIARDLVDGSHDSPFDGAAFHCYSGDVSAQSNVAGDVYTTECTGGEWATHFGHNLVWGSTNMLIKAFQNGSRAVLWWNIALDPSGGPTNGGCLECRGVITIDPDRGTYRKNVEYWQLWHIARFVPPGSVRVGVAVPQHCEATAFRTPDGRIVMLVTNVTGRYRKLSLNHDDRSTELTVPPRSLATLYWSL